ncbi:MAG: 50S ribosomal protein L22 [Candidatus Spechtbacterales bacterium]|nr:50S ribosomal protein L22 [Candidatus Spechtbacterales bacterium]
MKEYKAKLSYLRISPRKTRLVADLIRGMDVPNARYQLEFLPKRGSVQMLKLLNSAVSNAKDIDNDIDEKNLFVKTITVDQGPMLKRYQPVARGAVHEIQKKTSHITLILGEKKAKENKNKKKEKAKTAKS